MFTEIKKCRICNNSDLALVLDLGNQVLTGIFPKSRNQAVESMPLKLVKCVEGQGVDACGLLQLQHTGDLSKFYGENYGYRSGLNRSMVQHLHKKVQAILEFAKPQSGDLIIDIGSNDSTTLQGYPHEGLQLVGVDPTGVKFHKYYPEHIRLIPDFFSAATIRKELGAKKAKVITSFSMFYDLEDPISFMRQIHEVLADDGIWVCEQSYMPTMLEQLSYDTVCHEHLEYYGMRQIKWMADKVGFEILDVEFNDVNGGSFSFTIAKRGSSYRPEREKIQNLLENERELALHTLKPYSEFEQRVIEHREKLRDFVHQANSSGKKIFAYGASTKGNVILQYCGITEQDIPCVAEVNEDKFGAFTPGSLIPIISEAEAKGMKPDYFLVLPWHFRKGIVSREQDYLKSGGKLVFPMPTLDVC